MEKFMPVTEQLLTGGRLMGRLIPAVLVVLGLGLGFAVIRGASGQVDSGRGALISPQAPVGSAFTYQGRLAIDGAPAEGIYDFRFTLFDAATGGDQVGSAVLGEDVTVTDGLFTALLDFGSGAFSGQARWLELAVREGNSDGAYTPLAGRQPLTAAPYTLHAAEAGSAAWANVQNRPPGLDDGDDDTIYAAGAGLALAGTTFSAEGSPYANVLVVAHSGGDFSSVQAALDSIGDAGPANSYLVYVTPGIYTETVTLKSYVTLQGAGEAATIIRGLGGSEAPTEGSGSATLIGADNATVRHLTVESNGSGQNVALAILNSTVSPSISNVTASASGAIDAYGVFNYVAAPAMSNVNITVSGSSRSFGVYNYDFYNSSSWPTMSNVTIRAVDSVGNWGVVNSFSSPTMTNVTAATSGGNYNRGVYNGNSSPVMNDVNATASGSVGNYGVYNSGDSSPQMSNVTASASAGTYNYGVYNNNTASPTIGYSTLEGSTASVYLDNATAKVANSQLVGPPVGSGLTCFSNYDAILDPVICP